MSAEHFNTMSNARAEICAKLETEVCPDVLGAVLALVHEIQRAAWETGWEAGFDSGLQRGRNNGYKDGHRDGWNARTRAEDARRAAEEMTISPMKEADQ